MRNFDKYDVVIFDCDGVILDSNELKISAMDQALSEVGIFDDAKERALDYFQKNFGKSRYHHAQYFVENYLECTREPQVLKKKLLDIFADYLDKHYKSAPETPNVRKLLEKWSKVKALYVASGSEQCQLRQVMALKELNKYFKEIYGSPESKSNNVALILHNSNAKNALLIGDSVADFESAKSNGIDFLCYIPFSNVKDEMLALSIEYGFEVIENHGMLV